MKASAECNDNHIMGTKTFTFTFEVPDEAINETNFGWLLAKARLDRKMGLVSGPELSAVLLVHLVAMVKNFEDFKIQNGLEEVIEAASRWSSTFRADTFRDDVWR